MSQVIANEIKFNYPPPVKGRPVKAEKKFITLLDNFYLKTLNGITHEITSEKTYIKMTYLEYPLREPVIILNIDTFIEFYIKYDDVKDIVKLEDC